MPLTEEEIERAIINKFYAKTDSITYAIYTGESDNFQKAKAYLENNRIVNALRNYQNDTGISALHAAYKLDAREILDLLYEKGWDCHLKDKIGRIPSDYDPNTGFDFFYEFNETPEDKRNNAYGISK